jgi:ribosomal protein S14
VAAKKWSEVRPVPQGGKRSGLQTLCARADCEYDRGRGLEGDEGAGRTRGVYAEALAEFLICGMVFRAVAQKL